MKAFITTTSFGFIATDEEFNIVDNKPIETYRSYAPTMISYRVDGKQYYLKDYWL